MCTNSPYNLIRKGHVSYGFSTWTSGGHWHLAYGYCIVVAFHPGSLWMICTTSKTIWLSSSSTSTPGRPSWRYGNQLGCMSLLSNLPPHPLPSSPPLLPAVGRRKCGGGLVTAILNQSFLLSPSSSLPTSLPSSSLLPPSLPPSLTLFLPSSVQGEIETDDATIYELAACAMQAQHGEFKTWVHVHSDLWPLCTCMCTLCASFTSVCVCVSCTPVLIRG